MPVAHGSPPSRSINPPNHIEEIASKETIEVLAELNFQELNSVDDDLLCNHLAKLLDGNKEDKFIRHLATKAKERNLVRKAGRMFQQAGKRAMQWGFGKKSVQPTPNLSSPFRVKLVEKLVESANHSTSTKQISQDWIAEQLGNKIFANDDVVSSLFQAVVEKISGSFVSTGGRCGIKQQEPPTSAPITSSMIHVEKSEENSCSHTEPLPKSGEDKNIIPEEQPTSTPAGADKEPTNGGDST